MCMFAVEKMFTGLIILSSGKTITSGYVHDNNSLISEWYSTCYKHAMYENVQLKSIHWDLLEFWKKMTSGYITKQRGMHLY